MNYKAQYNTQKSTAKLRNIDWHFTYESWIGWWGVDIVNRGRKAGQLVMARIGDQGAYDPNNCVKKDCGSNVREAVRNYSNKPKQSVESNLKRSQALKGRIISDATKEKMRQSNIGRIKSEDTKKKIGLGNKGKVISQETRNKLSAASKPHSKEHEEKRLAAIKAYWANRKTLKETNNV